MQPFPWDPTAEMGEWVAFNYDYEASVPPAGSIRDHSLEEALKNDIWMKDAINILRSIAIIIL